MRVISETIREDPREFVYRILSGSQNDSLVLEYCSSAQNGALASKLLRQVGSVLRKLTRHIIVEKEVCSDGAASAMVCARMHLLPAECAKEILS